MAFKARLDFSGMRYDIPHPRCFLNRDPVINTIHSSREYISPLPFTFLFITSQEQKKVKGKYQEAGGWQI